MKGGTTNNKVRSRLFEMTEFDFVKVGDDDDAEGTRAVTAWRKEGIVVSSSASKHKRSDRVYCNTSLGTIRGALQKHCPIL